MSTELVLAIAGLSLAYCSVVFFLYRAMKREHKIQSGIEKRLRESATFSRRYLTDLRKVVKDDKKFLEFLEQCEKSKRVA